MSREVFETIYPIISYTKEGFGFKPEETLMERDQVVEIIDFEVCELTLDQEDSGVLQIIFKPKKAGLLKFEGLKWNFLEVEF